MVSKVCAARVGHRYQRDALVSKHAGTIRDARCNMNVSVTEARDRLSQLLTAAEQEPIVITRRGQPAGLLISPAEYVQLRKLRAYLEMLQLAEELRSNGITAKELQHVSRGELDARHP